MERFFRILIPIIVIVFLAYLTWRFSSIVAYILISAILSFIGHPLVRILDRVQLGKFKMPHVVSSLITLILILPQLFVTAAFMGTQPIWKMTLQVMEARF